MTRARDLADTQDNLGGAVAPFVAGKNAIINGNFDIWQRSTSFVPTQSTTMLGSADRWWTFYNGAVVGSNTVSRQTFSPGQTTVPGNPTYFIRTTSNGSATQTATDYYQRVEDVSTFAGQTATLSFWAQASNSGIAAIYFEQNFGSGGSATVDAALTLSAANYTTTWAKYTATFTLPSISGKTVGAGNYVAFRIRNFSSLVSGTFDLAQVQLELGSVATPFSRAGGSIGAELALCQRYYYRTPPPVGSSDRITIFGTCTGTTECRVNIPMPVQMRIAPSAVDFANLRAYDGAGFPTVTSLSLGSVTPGVAEVITVGTGYTAYRPTAIANNTNGYIGLTAEL